jgi:hypothetical protein
MSQNLLILGAGADRTAGIDFPLDNTLLADVTRYLDGPGKPVDQALRAMLPGLSFRFNTLISRSVDKIATREAHEQKAMVQRVQDAIIGLPPEKDHIRKHGELIIKLFNKLATIAEYSECCFYSTPNTRFSYSSTSSSVRSNISKSTISYKADRPTRLALRQSSP